MRWPVPRLALLQPRGLLLILLILLPLSALTISSFVAARGEARASAQRSALNMATIGAQRYAERVDGARQLLQPGVPFAGTAPRAPVAADAAACSAALEPLLRQHPGYSNLFTVDIRGDLVCSAVPAPTPVNVADRDYFQAVLRTRALAVGTPTVGRVSNRPAVVVAAPILDVRGEPIGVAGASLDLQFLVQIADAIRAQAGTSIAVVGRDGTILARNVDTARWIGQPAPRIEGVPDPFAGDGGTGTATMDGDIERLYGVMPLRSAGTDQAVAALYVGIPTSVAYGPAERLFRQQMLWLLGTGLVVSALAWVGSQILIVAPLHRIASATGRIARGDFATRTGETGQRGEIGVLAAAIDRMAEQLGAVSAERERDHHEMASVLASSPNVVTLVDAGGIVIRANAALERVFGFGTTEFVGHNVHELFGDLTVPGGWGDPTVAPFESIGHHADGHSFPVEVTIRPVEGTPPRFVVVLRDIADRKQAEADRELARVAEARLDFLNTVSHELRSPLNSVLGFGQLLDGELTDPRQRRQVQDIMSAGRHMLSLVNDLLDLSRIDAGRWETTTEEFDAVELIQSVIDAFGPQAAAKTLRLASDMPPEPIRISTDPRALREVLTNLIDNAVKFTARGGVGVHAERSRDLLEIRVIDTGVGIPQDALTSIFDPFVRLRTAETSGQVGSGLGLTITRRLVQLLRGTIAVSSNVGGGTTFTVRLPLGDRGPARP